MVYSGLELASDAGLSVRPVERSCGAGERVWLVFGGLFRIRFGRRCPDPLWRLVQARPVTVHTSQFPTLLSMPVRRFAPHLAPSRCSLLVGRSESEFRVIYVLIAFTLIITGGTIGYVVIEKWSWLDSFYMAIITVTTVGFAEVRPLTSQGRGFTIALLVLGVGSIFYAFGVVGEFLLSGQLGGLL